MATEQENKQKTQDILLWMEYKNDGGTLSLSDWIAQGRPPATPVNKSNPFTSNPPIPKPAPGTNPPHQFPGTDQNDPFQGQKEQDQIDYDAYLANEGQMSFNAWVSNGRPSSDADKTGGGEGGGDDELFNPYSMPSRPPPPGMKWGWDGMKWQPVEVEKETDMSLTDPTRMPSTPPPEGFEWAWDGKKWSPRKIEKEKGDTRQKKSRQFGAPDKYFDAYGREWTWDDYEGYTETGYDKTKDTRLTEKDKSIPQPPGEVPTDKYGRKATWDADDGEWRYPPDWDIDPKGEEKSEAARKAKEYEDRRRWEEGQATQAARDAEDKRRFGEDAAFRQQQSQQSSDQFWRQFDYQQQQDAARLAAEKEARLANLRANPASWLEYSLLSKQTPVVQPWMKPLMPQQYEGVKAGQALPGWAGLNQGSANLPELTTPSTQYFSRIGPTSQQQWGGYQQMQSGAPVEESLFRLKSQSAPGGRNPGLNWLR